MVRVTSLDFTAVFQGQILQAIGKKQGGEGRAQVLGVRFVTFLKNFFPHKLPRRRSVGYLKNS